MRGRKRLLTLNFFSFSLHRVHTRSFSLLHLFSTTISELYTTYSDSFLLKKSPNPINQRKSPYLIVSNQKCHLSVPFKIKPPKLKDTESVLSVDLGINTTALVSVVNLSGTVSHREFIHHGRDIDPRDRRLKRISTLARRTGKLHKEFCRSLYRKANNINREISQKVSSRLVKAARQYGVKYIVFEHLKGWRPKGGKKALLSNNAFITGYIVELST